MKHGLGIIESPKRTAHQGSTTDASALTVRGILWARAQESLFTLGPNKRASGVAVCKPHRCALKWEGSGNKNHPPAGFRTQ